jgi:low temperature requirement protein LtrA
MTMRRPAVPLRRADGPQRATFLELFFDLAFVFALFQLSHVLLRHLQWSGAFQTLVLLLAVWWVWRSTIWITDRLEPDRPAIQLLVIATLAGVVVLATALPEAFGRHGLVFAGVYITIQIGRNLFLTLAFRGHEMARGALRSLSWLVVSAAPWIGGALAHGTPRAALWTVAVALNYQKYALNFPWLGGNHPNQEPPASAEHGAERGRQVVIVALGEPILVSGLTFNGGGYVPDRTAAFALSIATTALFWRIYIYRAGEVLSAALGAVPVSIRLVRWASFVHVAMVAGVVVTAVAAELVISHPIGPTAPAWAIVIGCVSLAMTQFGYKHSVSCPASAELRPVLASFDHA